MRDNKTSGYLFLMGHAVHLSPVLNDAVLREEGNVKNSRVF